MTDHNGSALAADCLDLISAASTVVKIATKTARWGLESKETREGHPDFGQPNRVLLLAALADMKTRALPVERSLFGATERFNPERVNVGELERKLTAYRELRGSPALLEFLRGLAGYEATMLNDIRPTLWSELDARLNEALGLEVVGEKHDGSAAHAKASPPRPLHKWTWEQVEAGARSFSATYGARLTSRAIVRARTAANLNSADAVHAEQGKLPSLREAPEAWDLFMKIICEHSVRAKEDCE